MLPPQRPLTTSKLKKDIEDLEAQQKILLEQAAQGQGGEAVFKQLGELLLKMEITKKKLQTAQASV